MLPSSINTAQQQHQPQRQQQQQQRQQLFSAAKTMHKP